MKKRVDSVCGMLPLVSLVVAAALALSCASGSAQTTFLVWTNGNNSAPYDTWAKAATNIQTAVDAASPGDTVLVTNGTYAITAEIAIGEAITLRSVNGPDVTVVDASSVAGRRVLTNAAATVSGFTLRGGKQPSGQQGGNVWMNGGMLTNCVVRDGYVYNNGAAGAGVYMSGGIVTHCVISNNTNAGDSQGGRYTAGGGGVYMAGGLLENSTLSGNSCNGGGSGAAGGGVKVAAGMVRNCLIRDNTVTGRYAQYGGGAGVGGSGVLLNCTIVQNSVLSASGGKAGGVSSSSYTGGSVTNCIVYGNSSATPVSVQDIDEPGIAAYSCSPDLSAGVNGNITSDSLYVDAPGGDFRLSLSSPCRNAGANMTSAGSVDLDDGDRVYTGDGASLIDMGAYEVGAFGIPELVCDFAAEPSVGLAPLDVVLTATVLGPNTNGLYYWWDFDNSGGDIEEGDDKRVVTNTYTAGLYTVKLTVSNELGAVTNSIRTACVASVPSTMYVATNGNPVAPFVSWANAATNLADALAYQQDGGLVLVSNGTYTVAGELTLNKGVTVRGFNGVSNTTIQRVNGSYRLFALTHADAVLDGLTVQNGNQPSGQQGGNVWMNGGMLTNCVVRGGYVYNTGAAGAGVYMSGGIVTHCVISNNTNAGDSQGGRYTAGGGGVYMADGLLENSTLSGNSCNGGGSGAAGGGVKVATGMVRNCLIRDNTVTGSYAPYGGGAGVGGSGVLLNCTLVQNSVLATTGGKAGGVSSSSYAGGSVTNCIIYGNSSATPASVQDVDEPGIVAYSCSPDLTGGVNGNITGDPLFADDDGGDFRLTGASACRNAGTNVAEAGAVDLDDTDRILLSDGVGIVDMGAYETGAVTGIEPDFSADPVTGLAPLQSVFTATVLGETNGLYCWWDFDNDGNAETNGAGLTVVTNTYPSAGLYAVNLIVSNAAGTVTNALKLDYITAVASTMYVATNSASPQFPYGTWADAATNMADALAYQQNGGLVLVSNGTYTVAGELTLSKGVTVRGSAGPSNTVIRRESGSFRLFTLTHADAVLDGLTLSNGNQPSGQQGGNVWMSGGMLTNCVVRGGYIYNTGAAGAGVYMSGGIVTHCVITCNTNAGDSQNGRYTAGGGGVYMADGLLENSILSSNLCNGGGEAGGAAGGGVKVAAGMVRNCLIRDNTVTGTWVPYGGGAGVGGSGVLLNCTLVQNSVSVTSGGRAGGVSSSSYAGGAVTNCIIYGNSSATPASVQDIDEPGIAFFSCAPELTEGVNSNTTHDPLFVDPAQGDYTLLSSSPCYNTGLNDASWMSGATDLAGNDRILNGDVDMGAYETFVPPAGTVIFIK